MIILGAFSRQVLLPLKIITPDLTEEQQEIINKDLKDQIQRYKRHHDLSTTEGVKSLIKFIIKSYNVSVESLGIGCLEMIVQCPKLESLERLWSDCCSGVLDKVAERYLVTSELKRKLNLETVRMKTTITQEKYLMCKKALVEIEGQFLDLIDYEQSLFLLNFCRNVLTLMTPQVSLSFFSLFIYSAQKSKFNSNVERR